MSCFVALASGVRLSMQRIPTEVFFVAVCAMAVQANALAQSGNGADEKSFRIERTDLAPMIDGVLDEDVWSLVLPIDDFHQIDPNEYDEPSERTLVYLLYDDTHLYIGARLLDSQPGEITAQLLRQGSDVEDDDYFGVILDPFLDRRNGYLFQLNPNGVRAEALYRNTTQRNFDWVGIWRAQATTHEEGWTVEMAIPFKTLSFNPGSDSWGINFRRGIARNNETIGWMSRTRQQNPSIAGTAVGFTGLEQGLGLDIVPSLSARESRYFIPSGSDSATDPSVDVFYKFTPALTGVLTLNTDFSATEVDDRQVNLTRFGLLFPEKRDFFLQDADIFEFARLSGREFGGGGAGQQNGRPFFSRTIGLNTSRQPVDIEAGAKLTGRIGRWNLGVIDIKQADYEGVESSNLFVGRAVANVLDESNLGVIVTDGDPHSNLDNTVVGVDFRYLNSRLPGRRTAEGEAWYQKSSTPGLDGDDTAFGAGFRIRSIDKWNGDVRYAQLGENFNPALGFANRVGIREVSGSLNYSHRPRGQFYRNLFMGPTYARSERLTDGSLQSESIGSRMAIFNHVGDRVFATCSRDTEGLIRPFAIRRADNPADNVVIPAGLYTFGGCRIDFASGDQRKLAGRMAYESGDFYDGSKVTLQPGLTWRPSSHFAIELQYQINDVELPYGSFTSRLSRLRTDIVFSSRLSWVNLVQWDNDSHEFGINSRLHYIPQAGREVYLVLNHNLEDHDEDGTYRSMNADLTAKLNYTFRF